MYFTHFFILQIVFIKFINTKDICNANLNCDDCDVCEEFSKCNFANVFCIKDKTYKIFQEVHNNLTELNKKDPDITSFCNSRSFTFESTEDSFIIFESNTNTLSGMLTKLYNCEYYITNKYYYNHDTDQATLNIKINQKSSNVPEDSKIRFDILLIYNLLGEYYLKTYTDDSIRQSKFSKILDRLSEIEILINFHNNNTASVLESLQIDIETDNPSEKIRLIYLIIIIILCFFILVIIVLIVIYYFLKRRIIRDRERIIMEEEKKNNEKKELSEKFLKNELASQTFNDKINLNDCDMCTICCDKFVIGESQVSVTPCSHVFHHECIEKWIKEKITNPHCPNCKFSFLEYMEAQNKNTKEKNDTLNLNNNGKIVDTKHEKNQRSQEDNFPLSEQIRINSLNQNNEDANNINNNDGDRTIHLSENENNND